MGCYFFTEQRDCHVTEYKLTRGDLRHAIIFIISVCCHFIYNLFLLQDNKIEASRRGLTAILVDQVGITKMTSYSLLLHLLHSKVEITKTAAPEMPGLHACENYC